MKMVGKTLEKCSETVEGRKVCAFLQLSQPRVVRGRVLDHLHHTILRCISNTSLPLFSYSWTPVLSILIRILRLVQILPAKRLIHLLRLTTRSERGRMIMIVNIPSILSSDHFMPL